jgi:hypothetical protein
MVVAMINETAPALSTDIRDEGRPRLWDLLDEWMALDETRATWEGVEALYREIVDFWHADPDAAEGWYLAWRALRDGRRA